MRNFFQRIPFLRITSLFSSGILFAHFFRITPQVPALLITILISVLLFLWFTGNYTKIRIQNFVLTTLLVISGIFYPQVEIIRQPPDLNRKDYYLAEVCQKPAEKAKTFQTILKIQNERLQHPEKILAYFSKDSYDSTLQFGDQLIVLVQPRLIKNKGNPFEFDYQSFIREQGIWFSAYLPTGSWLKTSHSVNHFINIPEQIRQRLLKILSVQITGKEERSVIEALTLGYREELDPETKDYFASTGAMHVLAVSGLHVGLIYFILGFVFSPLTKSNTGRWLYPVVLILFLWLYALITGFSPSVQRATVMFTFVVIGNAIRRPVNILNSLSASALVLILINPDVIFKVGFQLSYLAVFGIVLIQPKLSGLIVVKNKILKVVWELFTVSIAAQLATFPLGLFYFNQMSNLFWISNFIVIPGAIILMWTSCTFFVFSFIPVISGIFAFILKWITHFMIVALKYLSELPIAVSDGIQINVAQVLTIYGILIAFLAYVFSKQKQWFFISLILVLCLQITDLRSKIKLFNQQEILVYNSPNHLIHLINSRKNYLVLPDGDSISGFEAEMIEQVKNHLRLAEPIVLPKEPLKTINTPTNDLFFNNREIRFLNSVIYLPQESRSGKYYRRNLEIQIRRQNRNTDSNLVQPTHQSMYKAEQLILQKDSAYCFYLDEK